MASIITKMGESTYSLDAIKRVEAARMKYCILIGEPGKIKVRYFYPAPDGKGYAVIAGHDYFGGKKRTANAKKAAYDACKVDIAG